LRLGIYLTAEQINPKSVRGRNEANDDDNNMGHDMLQRGTDIVVVVALRRGLGQMKLKCEAG